MEDTNERETNGSASEYVVVDRMETILEQQATLRKSMEEISLKLAFNNLTLSHMEKDMEEAERKWDALRALGLFTLPVAFAYLLEAAKQSLEGISPSTHLIQGSDTVTMALYHALRALFLAFAMCVGLPLLVESVGALSPPVERQPQHRPCTPAHGRRRQPSDNQQQDNEDEDEEDDEEERTSSGSEDSDSQAAGDSHQQGAAAVAAAAAAAALQPGNLL